VHCDKRSHPFKIGHMVRLRRSKVTTKYTGEDKAAA